MEFKKTQRDHYEDYDEKENPLEQSEKYIEQLLTGKSRIEITGLSQLILEFRFYVYIMCDVTPSLETILKRSMVKMPMNKQLPMALYLWHSVLELL